MLQSDYVNKKQKPRLTLRQRKAKKQLISDLLWGSSVVLLGLTFAAFFYQLSNQVINY